MLREFPIILITLVFFCSCKGKDEYKKLQRTFQDSVIREVWAFRDSLMRNDTVNYFYDSTEADFKLMQAIRYNDSNYFFKIREGIARARQERATNKITLDEKHNPVLASLNVEEGYQFSYYETFCNNNYSFTISKKEEDFYLHSIVYKLNRSKPDSFYLVIHQENKKKLPKKQWEEFLAALELSDFWGLSVTKNETGFDGSYLRVDGIIRNRFDSHIEHRHSVRRRFPHGTALYNSYLLLARLSGFQNMCKNPEQ